MRIKMRIKNNSQRITVPIMQKQRVATTPSLTLVLINKDTSFVIKDGDTCCTNPSLSNAQFWQYIKRLKNKTHTVVRRHLEETLDIKTFFNMSIGFKYRGSKVELRFCLVLRCIHFSTPGTNKTK